MRILLVEDDLDYINSYIAEIEKDYVVDVAYTASDGAYMSEVNDYDAIVVDCKLPDSNGYCLCNNVRSANIKSPILFLADAIDSPVRIECLKNGANVCLPKKVAPSELSAQIKALLRLRHSYTTAAAIELGNLKIDLNLQQVSFNNVEIELRCKEFHILEYLILNRTRIVSKEELLDHVWEEGLLVQSNSLEVHIRNIRLKIEIPFGVKVIKTVRGFGYKIE